MKKLIAFFLFLAEINLTAQETSSVTIEVKQFEYVTEKKQTGQIVLMKTDSVQALLKKSFIQAINQKWQQQLTDLPLAVKPLSPFLAEPKFKPKAEGTSPGKLYLFFQIFDIAQQNYSMIENSRAVRWRVKYALLDGKDNTIVENRNFYIDFTRKPPAEGQLIVTDLPSHPHDFYKTFDSVASWTLNDNTQNDHTVNIKQACIFNKDDAEDHKVVNKISFLTASDSLTCTGSPSFTLVQQPTSTVEVDGKKPASNAAGSVFTFLTGVPTNKRKNKWYTADHSFRDNDHLFHVKILYMESSAADRERVKDEDGAVSTKVGDYFVMGRRTDTIWRQLILKNNDTIGWFKLQIYKEQKDFTKMWDGEDSSTITTYPYQFKNTLRDSEVMMTGEVNGESFTMYTTNLTRRKWFTFNNKLIAVIYGYGSPVSGNLYQPLTEPQLKIITILSKLPYSFLNRDAEYL